VSVRAQAVEARWHCGPPGSLSSAFAGGFVAGLAGALVLILTRVTLELAIVAALWRIFVLWHAPLRTVIHRALLASVKQSAFPFVGDRVYEAGFDRPVVLLGILVLLVLSIVMGVVFALLARGRSHRVTCAIAIAIGLVSWGLQMLLASPSWVTVIETVPSGLAMAYTFLWYERRLGARRARDR
jgi:hypothetical protein